MQRIYQSLKQCLLSIPFTLFSSSFGVNLHLPYIKFHSDIRCTGIEPMAVADFAWIVGTSDFDAQMSDIKI
jgi:hypothetical protein